MRPTWIPADSPGAGFRNPRNDPASRYRVAYRLAEHLKRRSQLFMDETRALVLDPDRGRIKNRLAMGAGPRRPRLGRARPG